MSVPVFARTNPTAPGAVVRNRDRKVPETPPFIVKLSKVFPAKVILFPETVETKDKTSFTSKIFKLFNPSISASSLNADLESEIDGLIVNFIDGKDSDVQIPPETKVQLPTIAIEVVPSRKFKGYQLGGGQYVYTDVLFHCIAEDEVTRNTLVDIVSLQSDKTIQLFNTKKIHEDGVYPLDYRGSPVLNAKEYPEIVLSEDYNGGSLRLTNVQVQDMIAVNSNIYGGIVRMTTEGIKENI